MSFWCRPPLERDLNCSFSLKGNFSDFKASGTLISTQFKFFSKKWEGKDKGEGGRENNVQQAYAQKFS